MPERPPAERRMSFDEVCYGYTAEMARAEAERCLQCKNPTCQQGCPVNIDIKSFIGAIIEGDLPRGVAVLKERNALPAVCGRVCPQEEQCEASCVLAKKGDPVAIGRLERFLGDTDLACEIDGRCVPDVAPPSGFRCAVVGSGPAGLACAGELAQLGHAVTIFESLHAPGGVLSYGIPEFRLPKDIVNAEIEMLAEIGVEIVTNTVVGQLVTVPELLGEEGFDAVFVGSGAGLPVFLGVPGENLNGVYSANEFLTRVNLMRAYEFPTSDTPVWRGRKVAVVGGGNVAMDAARTALRLGAEEVFLVYRRTEDEMPARREEVHHAREEGVEFKMLCSPVEVVGTGRLGHRHHRDAHGAHRAGRERAPCAGVRDGQRVHHRLRHGDLGGGHARQPAAEAGGPGARAELARLHRHRRRRRHQPARGVRGRRHRHRGGDRHPRDGGGQEGRARRWTAGSGRGVRPRANSRRAASRCPTAGVHSL